jgi:predicted dehydrogenase
MAQRRDRKQTRRSFLSTAGKTAAAAASLATGFPAIVPASVFGATSPANRINVGAIGVGRISRGHDIPNIRKFDTARIMAVCDLDARRVEDGTKYVNDFYAGKTGKPYSGVTGYADYRELLANKDIDAVVISTPDHWHALIAIAAVEHGKDVYLQKPASLTIAEGRALSNAVHRSGQIFQIGSQQRSRVVAVRAVRRRHDHRLGRPSRRLGTLGHEHRVHRTG